MKLKKHEIVLLLIFGTIFILSDFWLYSNGLLVPISCSECFAGILLAVFSGIGLLKILWKYL